MPLEAVPLVLTLTFFGVCGLIGGVLVQGRRDGAARGHERIPRPHFHRHRSSSAQVSQPARQ
jgi:hypothetical protein